MTALKSTTFLIFFSLIPIFSSLFGQTTVTCDYSTNTITVCPNGCNYSSLQAAWFAALPNTTIEVSGTLDFSSTIEINSRTEFDNCGGVDDIDKSCIQIIGVGDNPVILNFNVDLGNYTFECPSSDFSCFKIVSYNDYGEHTKMNGLQIDNIEIVGNMTNPTDGGAINAYGIYLDGVSEVTLSRLKISNMHGNGINMIRCRNSSILNNDCFNNRLSDMDNIPMLSGADGLLVARSEKILIEGNRAYGNNDDGYDFKNEIGCENRHLIVKNNWAFDNDFGGFKIAHTAGSVFYRNISANNTFGFANNRNIYPNVFLNNTAYNNLYRGFNFEEDAAFPTQSKLNITENNLSYNNKWFDNISTCNQNATNSWNCDSGAGDECEHILNTTSGERLALTDDDFVSLDFSELGGERDPMNGNLPSINFLRPRCGSVLIEKAIPNPIWDGSEYSEPLELPDCDVNGISSIYCNEDDNLSYNCDGGEIIGDYYPICTLDLAYIFDDTAEDLGAIETIDEVPECAFCLDAEDLLNVNADVQDYADIDSPGEIKLYFNGGNCSEGLSFLWNDGNLDQDRIGLSPGTYCVDISCGTDCTITKCYIVKGNECNIDVTFDISHIVCNSNLSSSAASGSINITSPTEGYQFHWSPPIEITDYPQNGNVFLFLYPGEYCVTITEEIPDENGEQCEAVECINLLYQNNEFGIFENLVCTSDIFVDEDDYIIEYGEACIQAGAFTTFSGTSAYWIDNGEEIPISEDHCREFTNSGTYCFRIRTHKLCYHDYCVDIFVRDDCSEIVDPFCCPTIDYNDGEFGWGIWNDGGADANRAKKEEFANSGAFSFLIKDNTETSVITTESMDLSNYEEIYINFNYIAKGFNNANEDFWLQLSTDGGATFTTVKKWIYTQDFENDIRQCVNESISEPFTDNTKFRFRCDASGNNDKIYIDDIRIGACSIITCDDGLQNGDETGIDCGGSECPKCCDETDFNDAESGWGIWSAESDESDSDSHLSQNAAYANSGTHSFLIKDNTETSIITTELLDFSNYEEINLDFNFITTGFDNSNQDFWLQISDDGGASFVTIQEWDYSINFENDMREEVMSLVIPGPFTSETQLRFRCDASGNNDKVFIDDILIEACGPISSYTQPIIESRIFSPALDFELYPNPIINQSAINLKITAQSKSLDLCIYNIVGQVIYTAEVTRSEYERLTITNKNFEEGTYFISLDNGDSVKMKKMIILN